MQKSWGDTSKRRTAPEADTQELFESIYLIATACRVTSVMHSLLKEMEEAVERDTTLLPVLKILGRSSPLTISMRSSSNIE